jgi:hypothetical protein
MPENGDKLGPRDFLNPIVLLSLIIVLGVIALLAAAVLGIDKGVLGNMSRSEFARGLITYLFAVVTIGTAVVLVLSALLEPANDVQEKRFQRGKEILALLLGVFGTIVGFYFGQAQPSQAGTEALAISTLDVTPKSAPAGSTVTIRAVVTGGVLPYKFGVALGSDAANPAENVAEGGWITKELVTRQLRPGEPSNVKVVVEDGAGRRSDQTAPIEIKPPTK